MKPALNVICTAAVALAAVSATTLAPTASAADIGVSVTIGQPGFYGRIEIGDAYPQPQLVYPRPVVIRPVVGVIAQPVYLHVPPGHAKDWGKHCNRYNACGQNVYFVQDSWYNNTYVPEYQHKHGKGQKPGQGPGQGKGNGKGHGGDKGK